MNTGSLKPVILPVTDPLRRARGRMGGRVHYHQVFLDEDLWSERGVFCVASSLRVEIGKEASYQRGWTVSDGTYVLEATFNADAEERFRTSVGSRATSGLLPMYGSSAAAAIPSSSVDFPDPFSPTKNVTGTFTSIWGSVRICGTENGYGAPSPGGPCLSERRSRWVISGPVWPS